MRKFFALVAVVGGLAFAPSAYAYGWPIAPFDVQHPIRGYFGDPRIFGRARNFHSGVDIAAPKGTAVYPVESGFAQITGPMNIAVFGAHEFSYWHIVPAVRSGEWVTAYRTVLGRITARWLHVHFMEWSGGVPVNPLHPGGLTPYGDRTPPTIDGVTFVRDGSTVNPLAVAGTLDVVVTAHDEPAMSAPPPWNALPVAPVLIRWRVLAGANVVQPWRTAVDFRGALPPPWDYSDVYAPGTRQNFPNWPGRYRFFLERDWYANQLPDGDYVLEVAAWDTAGNTATEDVPFAVIGWMRVPRRR